MANKDQESLEEVIEQCLNLSGGDNQNKKVALIASVIHTLMDKIDPSADYVTFVVIPEADESVVAISSNIDPINRKRLVDFCEENLKDEFPDPSEIH